MWNCYLFDYFEFPRFKFEFQYPEWIVQKQTKNRVENHFSISSKSNKTDEPRSGQNQKRNPKRNVVRTKTITEMKPEPEIEKVTDAKADREQKLTDLCMANPKWSHVIHYHNKIKKYGVKLDLDTLLHGMLPPSDYKEIHDKCFGPQEVVLHEDQEEE